MLYFIPAAAATAISNTELIFLKVLDPFKMHFHEQLYDPACDGSLHVPVTPEAKGDYSIGA